LGVYPCRCFYLSVDLLIHAAYFSIAVWCLSVSRASVGGSPCIRPSACPSASLPASMHACLRLWRLRIWCLSVFSPGLLATACASVRPSWRLAVRRVSVCLSQDGEDLSTASKPRQYLASVYYATTTLTTTGWVWDSLLKLIGHIFPSGHAEHDHRVALGFIAAAEAARGQRVVGVQGISKLWSGSRDAYDQLAIF
jgi:hypothetical protein